MRESLKIAITATWLLLGCVPLAKKDGPPSPADNVVPKELVPPGFQPSECHFIRDPFGQDESDSGGSASLGGGVLDKADTGGHTRPGKQVECQRSVKPAVPTSSVVRHCGSAGIIRQCEDAG